MEVFFSFFFSPARVSVYSLNFKRELTANPYQEYKRIRQSLYLFYLINDAVPTEVVTWHLARNYDNFVSEGSWESSRGLFKCLPGDTEDNDKSIKRVNISTKVNCASQKRNGSYEDKCYEFNDTVATRQNICQKIKQMDDYEQWIWRDLEGCGCNAFQDSMSESFPAETEEANKVLQIPSTQGKIWTGD